MRMGTQVQTATGRIGTVTDSMDEQNDAFLRIVFADGSIEGHYESTLTALPPRPAHDVLIAAQVRGNEI